MANIEIAYFKNDGLRLNINMRPKGEVWVAVGLPKDFMDCIWKIAQASADLEEQKIRASMLAILADEPPKENKLEAKE
jgi:hypothetical protein